MQRDSDRQGEEDAWRAIIENYGDRVRLEGEDSYDSELETARLEPLLPPSAEAEAGPDAGENDELDEPDEDAFVPPEPPPLPAVPGDRMVAWIGLFGSPAILLLCLVIGFTLPSLIAYLLVGYFVGGFVYLVARMPRGPADPWDDGARL